MKNIFTATLSLALLLLAGAMAWLAVSIQGVTRELPAVMTRVDDVNARIDAIIETIPVITEALPPIVEEVGEVRKTIPSVLDEVAKVEKLVPGILGEVGQIRETIPSILTRVDAIQAQVGELRKELPLIAQTVDTAAGAANTIAGQVEATLPLVDKALKESEAIRGEIPATLDRVEAMVADAQDIAGRASQEAVTGVVKGVITSPYQLLKEAGKSISGSLFTTREITREDNNLVVEATTTLLHDLELQSVPWSNPRSGNRGTVTLQRAFKDAGTACVALRFDVTLKSGKRENIAKTVCLEENGSWQVR